METTYTIGVLAKEVGITAKAIRVYEKRGLLIPLGYTESRYRLYGEDAKLTLQKILTMKYLGFSLDEIKDRMEKEKGMDIRKSLGYQKKLLEAKRTQLNRLIYCVERAEERCIGETIDWESVADILKAVVMDRGADERHWFHQQHSTGSEDWYEQIYRKFAIKEGETVLDIGCGYGKLWRNNWSKLPKNLKVTLMDMHGTWADDLSKYLDENEKALPEGTAFNFIWGDAEESNSFTGKYARVIADYLLPFLKDKEKMLKRIKASLAEDGVFNCNGGTAGDYEKITDLLKKFNKKITIADELSEKNSAKTVIFEAELSRVFDCVERMQLENQITISSGEDFLSFLYQKSDEFEHLLAKKEEEFTEFYDDWIEKNGCIVIDAKTYFYKCR